MWNSKANTTATSSATGTVDTEESRIKSGHKESKERKGIAHNTSGNLRDQNGLSLVQNKGINRSITSTSGGEEASQPGPERVRHFMFELSMPNSGMFDTMMPTDHDILTTDKYPRFFHAIKEEVENKQKSCVGEMGTIGIEGVRLNAVSRLVMAVEDTNKALAKDKDALFYQFVGAAVRKADASNGFDGDCIALLYHAMSYDAVPLKAYETLLSVEVTGTDGRTTTTTDWSINSADLCIRTVCCVQNATNACENWR